MNELPAPPDAAQDPSAVEVARVWVVGQALHCALQTDAFDDPGSWGEVLADVARYAAQALADKEGHDPAQALARIRAVFEEETRPGDAPAPPG
jgi:hypothetical protein